MSASVAIIICTRDRADSLRETLIALAKCEVPADLAAELLVVDNGSTDHTAVVVRETRLPNLPVRYILETQPGQVRARNAGLRANRADVVLFTDDDVRPPAGWIEGMCRPILNGAADATVGWVHFPPHYEALLAREPFRHRRGWFASTEDINPAAPVRLVGANMAFSRRVVETLGEFDPELGPGALGFFDDSLWSWRLMEAGFRIAAAAPDISVEHHFDRSRLTRPTLLAMAERMGGSAAWVDYHWEGNNDDASAAAVGRTRLLLRVAQALTPWRSRQEAPPLWELQRVQNLAYLEMLRSLRGQPRKYHRTAKSG